MANAAYMITAAHQADDLIDDIRRALRRSRRTGGGYGVYRPSPARDGGLAVNIEIAIDYTSTCQTPRPKPGQRRRAHAAKPTPHK